MIGLRFFPLKSADVRRAGTRDEAGRSELKNPLPVKRNFTQIPLTRMSNHNDLAAFDEHE